MAGQKTSECMPGSPIAGQAVLYYLRAGPVKTLKYEKSLYQLTHRQPYEEDMLRAA